jgi:DNA adenine methylase
MNPIIRFMGDKTQIIHTILPRFPKEFDNYHENFIGAGSVLFGLLKYKDEYKIKINGNIYAYDMNETLINMYKNIQNHPNEIYENLTTMFNDYFCIKKLNGKRNPVNYQEAISSKESYYYWIRAYYNNVTQAQKNTPLCSAMLIFLNKTGFRGLYRTSCNGFNVGFGGNTNPIMPTYKHLIEVHNLIRGVNFICSDFTESLSLENNTLIKENDFIYLDPPQAPVNKANFMIYSKEEFTIKQHIKFFQLCNILNDKNIKFVMSNAKVKFVTQSFNSKFNIETIIYKKNISLKNPGITTQELLISNF